MNIKKSYLKARTKVSALALAVLCVLLFSSHAIAATYKVGNQNAYSKALTKVKAGDTIVLKNGVWQDFEILFEGQGTADKPITLKAQTKGKVILSGLSNLRLAGEHLVVSGLVFRDGYTPTSAVIAFRKDKTKANISNKEQKAFVTQFVETHVSGIKLLTEDDRTYCPKCEASLSA